MAAQCVELALHNIFLFLTEINDISLYYRIKIVKILTVNGMIEESQIIIYNECLHRYINTSISTYKNLFNLFNVRYVENCN